MFTHDDPTSSLNNELSKLLSTCVERSFLNEKQWEIHTDAHEFVVFAPYDWPRLQESSPEAEPVEEEANSEVNDDGWYLCYIPVPFLAYYALTGHIFHNGVGYCFPPSVADPLWLVFRLHHALCVGSAKPYEELVSDFYQSTPSLKKAGFHFSPDAGGNIVKEVPIDWNALVKGGKGDDKAFIPLQNALTELFSIHADFDSFVRQYPANSIRSVSYGPSVETVFSNMRELVHELVS